MAASRANGSDHRSQTFMYSKGPHRKGVNLRHRKSRLTRVKSSYHWSLYCQWGQDFIPNMPWDFEGVFSSPPQGKARFLLKPKGLRTSEALRMFRKIYTMCFECRLKHTHKPKFNSHLYCVGQSRVKRVGPSYHFSGAQPCWFPRYMWVRHTISIPLCLCCVMPLERQTNQQQGPSQRRPDIANPKPDGIHVFLSLDVPYKIWLGDRKL